MTDSRPASPPRPSWLQPNTEEAMRAAYGGALGAGQGGAAAVAAACTALLAEAPGLTPLQIGEALGIVAVASGATNPAVAAAATAPAPPDGVPGDRRQPGPDGIDDADFVVALAYALRHDERGRPRKGAGTSRPNSPPNTSRATSGAPTSSSPGGAQASPTAPGEPGRGWGR